MGKEFLLDILTQEEDTGFICHEIITPEVTSDVTEYKRIQCDLFISFLQKLNKSIGQGFQSRVTKV